MRIVKRKYAVAKPKTEFCGEVRVMVTAMDNYGRPMSSVNGYSSMSFKLADATVEEVHSFLLDACLAHHDCEGENSR